MNKNTKYICLAGMLFPLGMLAQTSDTVLCDFESQDSYTSVGVYDTWAESPFRTHKLNGNAAVVNNHLNAVDGLLGYAPNASSKILGVQRSRFGSNTFGALVGLKNTFALKKSTQYVHVKMYTPKASQVMLIGLGNRDDRPNQSPLTEQFWSQSTIKTTADSWCDMVFPVSGSNGITIRNLLVVVDNTSPHNLTEDYAAYVDDIVLSSQADPFFMAQAYPVNFDEDTEHKRGTDRYMKGVTFSSSDGSQTLEANQSVINRLYIKRMDNAFSAKPGDKVNAGFIKGAMSWMGGYLYLDKDNDGLFNVDYDDNGVNDAKDLVSYTQYKNKNSAGGTVADNTDPGLNLPSFTIPKDMKPGFYRLRYKVDWDNVNPGGNTTSGQMITDNGGMILDTRVNIHNDEVELSRATDELGGGGLNGDILLGDGSAVTGKKVPFGKDLKIKMQPAPGFRFNYVVMRHGYNLTGDSLIQGNLQWKETIIRARVFRDNEYTIPGNLIDGDVQFIPYFSSDAGGSGSGDYALNFDPSLQMADPTNNLLASFKMLASCGETTTITVKNDNAKTVYRNLTPKEIKVHAGDAITPTISYKGNAKMNAYLYLDMNQDGNFFTELNQDGTPTDNSELLAYTFYKDRNSRGETVSEEAAGWALPKYRIPEDLPTGIYRARLKLDCASIDPAGSWTQGAAGGIDETGGYVVDFLVNVHNDSAPLSVDARGGHVQGRSNTGIPTTCDFNKALNVVPAVPASGYVLSQLKVKHGQNLDGPQYVCGNRQWNEYVATNAQAGKSLSIPKDSVNGEVRITAKFTADGSEEYKLVFSDEFDGENGAEPNQDLWSYCTRENPTWKRFVATSTEGQHATAFLSDGKLVTRCVPNNFSNEGNVEMVSGAIESAGKVYFAYGRVEGRMKTTAHTGNFPAFWMMPEDNSAGWPNAGEIDIWEQIDTENKSYHTIHTNVSYNLHLGAANTGNLTNVTTGDYHVIALEWEPDLLTWYVDGKKAFSYAKSTDADLLSKGQWPFDKPFYLILNQSVGNGSWAANCDASFQYETLFDYVRVYQKTGQNITVPTGINTAEQQSRLDYYVKKGQVLLVAPEAEMVRIVDMQGRTVFAENVQGNRTVSLTKGVYVLNGHKVLVP